MRFIFGLLVVPFLLVDLWGAGAIINYVNPMSPDGGTGLERSIDPANPNRSYRWLKHWETQNLNLVALGSSMTVICWSTQTEMDTTIPFEVRYDTSPVSISGWTTSATNTITIMPDDFSAHLGTMTGHGYKLVPTNINGSPISFSDGYWYVNGLTIMSSGTNAAAFPAMVNIGAMEANTTGYLLNNIIGMSCDGDETVCRGLWGGNANVKTVIAQNNLFFMPSYQHFNFSSGEKLYQNGSAGFPICVGGDTAGATFNFYNNTCANGWYQGVNNAGIVVVAKNNIIQNTSNNSFAGCSAGSFNNVGDDATTCGDNTITNAAVSFANAAQSDWHLANNDTVAQGKCVSLSTDSAYASLFDYEGGTRTASAGLTAWDCGCDEVGTNRATVAAAGGGGGDPGPPAGNSGESTYKDYIIQSRRYEESFGRPVNR